MCCVGRDFPRKSFVCIVDVFVGYAGRGFGDDGPVSAVPAVDTSVQGVLTVVIVCWDVIDVWTGGLGKFCDWDRECSVLDPICVASDDGVENWMCGIC